MKVRQDFVTNSSSSSFIISTKENIPEGYETRVDKIDENTIISVLDILSHGMELEEPIIYGMEDEQIKEFGNFTDEQIMIIKLIQAEKLELYMELKKRLEKGENLYHIYEDRDWLYYQDVLCKFIDDAELINKETDL